MRQKIKKSMKFPIKLCVNGCEIVNTESKYKKKKKYSNAEQINVWMRKSICKSIYIAHKRLFSTIRFRQQQKMSVRSTNSYLDAAISMELANRFFLSINPAGTHTYPFNKSTPRKRNTQIDSKHDIIISLDPGSPSSYSFMSIDH